MHSWGEKRGRLPLVDAGDRPFACRRRNQRGGTEGRRERSWKKKKSGLEGPGKGFFLWIALTRQDGIMRQCK